MSSYNFVSDSFAGHNRPYVCTRCASSKVYALFIIFLPMVEVVHEQIVKVTSKAA